MLTPFPPLGICVDSVVVLVVVSFSPQDCARFSYTSSRVQFFQGRKFFNSGQFLILAEGQEFFFFNSLIRILLLLVRLCATLPPKD